MIGMVMVPLTDVNSRANKTNTWRTQKPVIDYSSCIRCMICWKFCPDNAIEYSTDAEYEAPSDRIARLEAPVIEYDYCKGCGICSNECPENSIEMLTEEAE